LLRCVSAVVDARHRRCHAPGLPGIVILAEDSQD